MYAGDRYFSDAIVDAEEENQETVDAFFISAKEDFNEKEKLKRALYAARKKSSEISSVKNTDKSLDKNVEKNVNNVLNETEVANVSSLNNW